MTDRVTVQKTPEQKTSLALRWAMSIILIIDGIISLVIRIKGLF